MTHMEWPYFELVYFIYVKGTKEFDETICSAERTCDEKKIKQYRSTTLSEHQQF